ncbi:hypothetical protein IMZ48_04020 [Candidatus Bathyarchaeota archaeon]|nr:hypothetical protein [Candidatus Bathyarchaeota archaeon]
MSPKTIHPALAFKKPTPALVDREARACVDRANRKAEDASTLKDLVLNPSKPRRFLEYRSKYSFNDLPEVAQRRIFQLLFSYPDRLVHAISRLDQHMEPADVPPVHGKRSGLLNRFHITGKQGGRRCSLNYAVKGNDLLAPLLVSRKFLFLGAHAFYGRNTFAFSSVRSASPTRMSHC